ncbi:MAG: vWA domain-containing protein, partial [Planctomycetia bacterium]
KMFQNSPQFLSAAVLYENMVIQSYDPKYKLPAPIVAIYPKEGTFWCDHPCSIVQRDWVTPEHKEAATLYVDYLLEKPQQLKAFTYGFRPADTSLPLGAPIDKEHGVDPTEPKALLEIPTRDVVEASLGLWRKQKKTANVVLVVDVSGTMNEDDKMTKARSGLAEFISLMGDQDRLSIVSYASEVTWLQKDVPCGEGRPLLKSTIGGLVPYGKSALFDAVYQAYEHVEKTTKPDEIGGVVVLSDGDDTASVQNVDTLGKRIKFDPEKAALQVVTIAYGTEANKDELKKIAKQTLSKAFEAKPEGVVKAFREAASFFGAGTGVFVQNQSAGR